MKKILLFIFLTLGIGIFISCQKVSSESKRMNDLWKRAQKYHKDNIPMPKDTMFLRAFQYFREKGDDDKLMESYLLEAFYYAWNKEAESAVRALDEGLNCSSPIKDTIWNVEFYRAKSNVFYMLGMYQEAIQALYELLEFSDKLSKSERSYTIYKIGLNLSLIGSPDFELFYEKSIHMAMASQDTLMAVHYLKNYADALGNPSVKKYRKSNDVIQSVFNLSPQQKELSNSYITLIHNHLNLHQIDSAKHYLQIAWENEERLLNEKKGDATRVALLLFLQELIHWTDSKPIGIRGLGRFNDSITIDRMMQQRAFIRETEWKYQLQYENQKLQQDKVLLSLYIIIGIILAVALAGGGWLLYRDRIKRLAEAEERIGALTQMLEETNQTASNQTTQPEEDAYFKKLLLQQLGLYRLVATSPTDENKALLHRVHKICNDEIPTNALLDWDELYLLIDHLYDNFHSRLMECFGAVLTDKEVQICCLICAGFSTNEIAAVTQQGNDTIYTRKSSIRRKVGAKGREDIVAAIRRAFGD